MSGCAEMVLDFLSKISLSKMFSNYSNHYSNHENDKRPTVYPEESVYECTEDAEDNVSNKTVTIQLESNNKEVMNMAQETSEKVF